MLGHLFLGQPEFLPCGNGSLTDPGNRLLVNSNGDSSADLADAVYLLAFLFQGQAPPVLGMQCQPIPGCPESCAP